VCVFLRGDADADCRLVPVCVGVHVYVVACVVDRWIGVCR